MKNAFRQSNRLPINPFISLTTSGYVLNYFPGYAKDKHINQQHKLLSLLSLAVSLLLSLYFKNHPFELRFS
jgi:hypothetical protein